MNKSGRPEALVTLLPREKMYDNQGPCGGFLMLQCEGCGAVHSFYTKHKLYSCRCNKCKTETPLEELLPVYMQCKCGRSIKYRTNLRDPLAMGTCISCGKPVALRLNYRKTAYVTLGREGKR